MGWFATMVVALALLTAACAGEPETRVGRCEDWLERNDVYLSELCERADEWGFVTKSGEIREFQQMFQ